MTVVMEIMNPNFKTTFDQILAQLGRRFVAAFGNEVERRSKTQLSLKFRQPPALSQPGGPLDIVSDDEREFLPLRPSIPAGRSHSSALVNGPVEARLTKFPHCQIAPHRIAQAIRHERLDSII